jgi:cell division protein FtsW (lipid II flippase)
VERQVVWLVLAFAAMLTIAAIPPRLIAPLGLVAYSMSLALLVLVLFMPAVNGSRRWIPLGFFDMQPSEPARLSFILALAAWLRHRDSQRTFSGLLPPVVLALVPMLLIVREPDLDTALLFVPVLLTMLAAAGARGRHLLVSLLAGLACLPVLWTQMSAEQRSRIVSVFIQQDGGLAPTGDGFHLHQSKQLLALNGLAGSALRGEMPLPDDPAARQLPAARTDFVFVMIGERLGFAGCATLLALYCALIWMGLRIAARADEPFSRLVATGCTTLLAIQVVLNTGMTVGLLPITGTALPLCGYGGSSLICSYAAIGLLAGIHRHRAFEVAGQPFQPAVRIWQRAA